VARKMYHLTSSFSYRGVTISTTHVLKVRTPLPVFLMEVVYAISVSCVLAEVETEADRILGSFGPKEHDALTMAKLPNGGHLYHIF
jgi:hypothetical protein